MTQTCSFTNGVTLHFLGSGIVLLAYEIDIRIQRNRLSIARAKISVEAGQLLSRRIPVSTDNVELRIDDEIQGRYIFDSQDIEQNQGDRQAWITLKDPLHALNDHTITVTWDSVTPEVAVNTILDRFEERSRFKVFEGMEFASEGVENKVSRSNRQVISDLVNLRPGTTVRERVGDDDGIFARARVAAESAGVWAVDQALDIMPKFNSPNYAGGFEFDDTPLLSALMQVCEEFGMTAWVDNYGTLRIGLPELTDKEIIPIYGDPRKDELTISHYNITQGETDVNRVIAKGSSHWYPNQGRYTGNLYPEAEAWTGGGGSILAIEEPLRIRSQAALENYVRAKLVGEYASYKNGNIVFNGLASQDASTLIDLGLGDSVLVSEMVAEHCRQDVDGGHFVINEVHHQINTRVGWQVTVTVGGVPPLIRSKSYMVDRQSLETFDSVEDFWDEEDDDGGLISSATSTLMNWLF